MRLPVIELPTVYHIGSLDPTERGSVHKTSQEGAGLSVSLCPEAWREIAEISGPLLAIEHDAGIYLDILKVGRAEKRLIGEWAIAAGLMVSSERFRAWSYDPDGEEWRYALFETHQEAEAEVRADFNENDDIPVDEIDVPAPLPRGRKLVEPEVGLKLSPAGLRRTLGYGADIDGFEFAAMFFAEDVLMPADPTVVGVWWRERFDPDLLSAPRGAIFPGRLPDMQVKAIAWAGHEDVTTVPRSRSRSFEAADLALHSAFSSGEAAPASGPTP